MELFRGGFPAGFVLVGGRPPALLGPGNGNVNSKVRPTARRGGAHGALAPHLGCFPSRRVPPQVLVESRERLRRERGQGEPRWPGAAKPTLHVRMPALFVARLPR